MVSDLTIGWLFLGFGEIERMDSEGGDESGRERQR